MRVAGVVGLIAIGCSGQLEPYTADGDTGSTHALVGVERSVLIGNAEAARAGVIAGFVQIPADVDAKSLFELVGLSRAMPSAGHCRARGESRSTPSLSSIGHVEFLEAGDVSVSTSEARTSLAPHAFPTVTDLISGVVYTSRDRSADPLPAGTRYSVTTSGGGGVPALSVERDAPRELESITVGGDPLGEVNELSAFEPLDLTWAVGTAGDLILVEVTSADGAASTACAFRDDHGAGTVPALGVPGTGRISLHRVRSATFDARGLDVGELRFDFEVAAGVTFTE